MAFKRSAVRPRLSPQKLKLEYIKMKMSTLRDQSKPLLYGLIVLFVLAMGNFASIFSSANPNSGNSENCDPTIFVACSDDDNIVVTKDEYYSRYNSSIAVSYTHLTLPTIYSV